MRSASAPGSPVQPGDGMLVSKPYMCIQWHTRGNSKEGGDVQHLLWCHRVKRCC